MISFSVLIPARDAAPTLPRALGSVLAQTSGDLEAIIINDGSEDHTAAIARSYAERDPRVRLVSVDRSVGLSGARNLGLDAARGDWIVVLDADDWLAPDRLRLLAEEADLHDAQTVADNQFWVYEGRSQPYRTFLPSKPVTAGHETRFIGSEDLLHGDRPGGPANLGLLKPMVRRSFLEAQDIRYRQVRLAEDFYFLLDCCVSGGEILFVDRPLYYYEIRRGSLSRTTTAKDYLTSSGEAARVADDIRGRCTPETSTLMAERCSALSRYARYRAIVDPIKEGDLTHILPGLFQNPDTLGYFPAGLLRYARRRLAMRHLD